MRYVLSEMLKASSIIQSTNELLRRKLAKQLGVAAHAVIWYPMLFLLPDTT